MQPMLAGMCNDFEQHIAWAEYSELMRSLELGIPTQQGELDLPRTDDIKIGDIGPVMRAAGDAIELAPMRFGFPPANPKGGPVFNFRSEGRRFADSNRCLVPASAFFEFTGKKYPKAKHRFTLRNAPFLAIAGLWRDGQGNQPPSFTMLTTEPGPDVEALPQSAGRGAMASGLGVVDPTHQAGGGAAQAAPSGIARRRNRAGRVRLAVLVSLA